MKGNVNCFEFTKTETVKTIEEAYTGILTRKIINDSFFILLGYVDLTAQMTNSTTAQIVFSGVNGLGQKVRCVKREVY